MAGITTEEWLKALEDAFKQAEGDGLSSREVAKALGISHNGATRLIRQAVDTGEMEFAGRRRESRMDGRTSWVPVYRPVGQ